MVNFFIRRPIFAIVTSIIIVILGLLSIRTLPVEQYPNISPPNVQVSAIYQGADAITVDESVATPVGQSIMGVSDMLYMETNSASDGSMNLTATFAIGSNPDMNTVFTQNRVATATPMLPSSVRQQGVTTVKAMTGFLMVYAIYSDGRYDDNFLSNYATINIQNELLKINGVGKVQILGAGEYSMRIWVKPDVMNYLNVSLNDITSAIEAQSGIYAAGKLGAEPNASPVEFTYTVLMPPSINKAEDYANIIIKTLPDGSQIRLSDVARVDLGSQSYGVSSSFNGKPAAMVAVFQTPGSNAMDVGTKVNAKMEELSQRFYDGIDYSITVDSVMPIRLGVKDILSTLLLALVLVMLIIYLFLQDIRAMIVPVVAIPVSLIGAFMLFPLLGFSINMFSLLGLILAIGLVVDDAIVVVEAVQVKISMGLDAKQATREAMKSVSSPIIATTISLCAVFVPVSFISGITGELYKQFAITIALSIIISAFNALTLSPALCALLLRNKPSKEKGFFGWFNKWFGNQVTGYLDKTKTIVRHASRSLVLIGVIALSLFFVARVLPTGFIPQEDQGFVLMGVSLPDAASLERTQDVMTEVEAIVSSSSAVANVASVSGYSMLSGVEASNSGMLFITLKPYDQRSQSAMELVDKFNEELYFGITDAEAFAFLAPAIPGLGASSGLTMMIQDRGGNGINYLATHTDEFIKKARELPEISSLSSEFSSNVPQRQLVIDENAAFIEGVSMSQIHSVLSTYLGGTYLNNFNKFGRVYQTYIQSEAEYRQKADDLMNYYVTNSNGQSVPLSTFVSIKDTTGVEYVTQFNLYQAIAVNANPSAKYSSTQAMDALEKLANETLPNDMSLAWNGMSFQERNASGGAIYSFATALVFVFLILAALYESWTLPWSILMGVPFAAFGAMIFVYVAHLINPSYINNIFMQVSLILLIGLSAKNAILIVEYANIKFFDEGRDVMESAVEAAKMRLRPIIMTAMAFLLGVSPLIFSTGPSAGAENVMGIALIGGMGIATMLGIFVYPSLYVFIAKIGKFERIRERRNNENKSDEKKESTSISIEQKS